MRNLTDDVVNTANNFVQNMKQYFDTPLDYSIESLEEIDEMLDGLGKRREEMTEDAFFFLLCARRSALSAPLFRQAP